MQNSASSLCLLAVAMIAGVGFTSGALAEAPAQQTQVNTNPRFDIAAFKVEGNTLLPQQEVELLVKPFAGLSRDFGHVQQALEALQKAYQKRGFGAVQVLLPEQELERGIVELRVVEQKITQVVIEGNEHYEDANVLAATPSVREGAIPNMGLLARNLKVANENPTKQVAVLFRGNDDAEESVEVTVKVIDEKPWKAFITADNTGNRETGNGRIGIGFQHFNLWNKDHRLTVQYITNMHFPQNYFNPDKKVNILGGAYTIPFYEWGDSLDLVAGYSDVESGTFTGGLNSLAGKGVIAGAHYNRNFDKIGAYDHKLAIAFDYRAFRNDLLDNNGNAQVGALQHVTSTPLSLTYSGVWQQDQRRLSASAGISANVYPDLMEHGKKEIYDTYNAEDKFLKFNYEVDYVQTVFKTWQLHAGLSGQSTGDHLISGEQFRVGGMETVRGWHESALSGDKGYRWGVEMISPDFGKPVGELVNLRGVLFYEKAHVNNNRGVDSTDSSKISDKAIASIGAGLRYNYGSSVIARLDYAYVVDGDRTRDNPLGSQRHGDTFGHVSLAWVW